MEVKISLDCTICHEPFLPELKDKNAEEAGSSESTRTANVANAAAEETGALDTTEASAAVAGPSRKRARTVSPRKTSSVVCTPCGHIFHRECINRWMAETRVDKHSGMAVDGRSWKTNCPTCRHEIRHAALYPAYFNFDCTRVPSPIREKKARDVNRVRIRVAGDENNDEESDDDEVVEVFPEELERVGYNQEGVLGQGNCTRLRCVDRRMFLQLAQKECEELNGKLRESNEKYEEAVVMLALRDSELIKIKEEMKVKMEEMKVKMEEMQKVFNA